MFHNVCVKIMLAYKICDVCKMCHFVESYRLHTKYSAAFSLIEPIITLYIVTDQKSHILRDLSATSATQCPHKIQQQRWGTS